jgi:hypothetical protein
MVRLEEVGVHKDISRPGEEMGLLANNMWGGKRNGWTAYSLPNPAIIPQPEKVAGMVWIWEVFKTLISSKVIAVLRYFS